VLIVSGREVRSLLEGRERELLAAVRDAYRAHAAGATSVPHSLFLRIPGDAASRIIALPAFLGGDAPTAGVKWVASFPGNLDRGLERASAVVVLNSPETGRPEAILEGSIVNAKRTAASAALAATTLRPSAPVTALGLIGCGLVGFEIVAFLAAIEPGLERVGVFDVDTARAEQLHDVCVRALPSVFVDVLPDPASVLRRHPVVAFATTAARPYLDDLEACPPGAVLLHVSLRDVTPAAVLRCDNVVDDADHVCREETSLHLTERLAGGRDFIRCSLGEILLGNQPARLDGGRVALFSPFGLGILDLAVARLARRWAMERGVGVEVDDFFPAHWTSVGPAAPRAAS
jgi:2,3-diaminopropionate biosynthesis protein SbnB